jgi:hypothetical protein
MTNKIVYALVKIPIELLPDGEINTLTDRINIEFEPCYELPEPKNIDYSSIMESLMDYIGEDYEEVKSTVEEEAKTILKEEIKGARARAVNSSFKRRMYKRNHTAKTLA